MCIRDSVKILFMHMENSDKDILKLHILVEKESLLNYANTLCCDCWRRSSYCNIAFIWAPARNVYMWMMFVFWERLIKFLQEANFWNPSKRNVQQKFDPWQRKILITSAFHLVVYSSRFIKHLEVNIKPNIPEKWLISEKFVYLNTSNTCLWRKNITVDPQPLQLKICGFTHFWNFQKRYIH